MGKRKTRTKEKIIKNNKGITILALVVTIIVLLILAGVSISMITGDSGIINQAKTAKEETEKGNVIEKAQKDILAITASGRSDITQQELHDILEKYFESVPDDVDTDDILTTKEEYGGKYEIAVSDIYDGEIEIKGITAAELTDEQKKELYGKYVTNYECSSNDAIETTAPGKWMIFHIDDDNIYLIASDYIDTDYCPTKDGATVTKSTSYPKGASFSGVYSKYAGSADITDERIKALNSDFFNKYTSASNNMKSVAYMLDTNAWSGFVENNIADYAIGGPTIELLFESYNKAHPDKNYPSGKYKTRASSTTGYQISVDGGSNWNTYISSSSDYLDSSDPTYVINSTSNAYGMWVASPSGTGTNNVMYVYYIGRVYNTSYNADLNGFRPLVSLKSDVQLKKTGDNTYEIIK